MLLAGIGTNLLALSAVPCMHPQQAFITAKPWDVLLSLAIQHFMILCFQGYYVVRRQAQ